MQKTDWKLKRTAKGKRPNYLPDPSSDKLLAIVMALAGEVSVMRDRMETIERLSDRGGVFPAADIETYTPSPEELAQRSQRRADHLARVFRAVQEEIGALSGTSFGQSAKDIDG